MRTEAHRVNYVLCCLSKYGKLAGVTQKCRVYIQTQLSVANYLHLQCSFISPQGWHSLFFTALSHFSNAGYTQRAITGSSVQVPESRIFLIMFGRQVLKVIKDRSRERWNKPYIIREPQPYPWMQDLVDSDCSWTCNSWLATRSEIELGRVLNQKLFYQHNKQA